MPLFKFHAFRNLFQFSRLFLYSSHFPLTKIRYGKKSFCLYNGVKTLALRRNLFFSAC